MKYYHVDRLSQLLASYHRSATNIQRVVRGWRGRKVAAVLREERRVRAVVRMQTGRVIVVYLKLDCRYS